jgi:hypothetical protein
MICVDIINPKTSEVRHIVLPIPEAVMKIATYDISVSKFVGEFARDRLPSGFMLIGHDLRSP